MLDLVGKVKYSINSNLWGTLKPYNVEVESGAPDPDISENYKYNKMTFLRYGDQGYLNKDTLRAATGHAWNAASKNLGDASSPNVLDHSWGGLNLFYGRPLFLDVCDDGKKLEPDDTAATTAVNAGLHKLYEDSIWTNKIVLWTGGLRSLMSGPEAPPHEHAEAIPWVDTHADGEHIGKTPGNGDYARGLFEWAAYVRLGLSDGAGKTYYPIINSSGYEPPAGLEYLKGAFFDHVYKSSVPFTPGELLKKQPFGKASKASVKTWYNTALDTKRGGYLGVAWEKFVNVLGEKRINATPTPYGFLRIMLNKFQVAEDLYDQSVTWTGGTGFVTTWRKLLGQPQSGPWEAFAYDIKTKADINREVFLKYPYELLITMFGNVDPKVITKFTNINPKEENVQYQVEKYFDAWRRSYYNCRANVSSSAGESEARNAINRIDVIFDNVAVSPSVLKNVDKINQIKKYFPYYSEIEFTTTQYTELGDIIKKTLFGKYFINKIAGYNTTGSDPGVALGNPEKLSFRDYKQEQSFEGQTESMYISGAPTGTPLGELKTLDKNNYRIVENLSAHFNDDEEYSTGPPDGTTKDDVRNHIAYLRDDIAEPYNVTEFNTIWKAFTGAVLQSKLIEVYNKNLRTYKDLVDGVPAYTEDIAYKIEKYAIEAGKNEDVDDNWVLKQNIIIPNTSDINIFNYVDTQLRYGSGGTNPRYYKYKIYAIKIVFGCAYKYKMLGDDAGLYWQGYSPVPGNNIDSYAINPQNAPAVNNLDGISWTKEGYTMSGNEDNHWSWHSFNAMADVEIYPDIIMVEDLFYTSNVVKISDYPPCTPDVNIVPYRAQSDKILILLNGMMDRYRAYPEIILKTGDINRESDIKIFDFIKEAQLSPDGKILFSSDDPVKKFQIFRTKNKPSGYTDFELHRTISGENTTHYEDSVIPNQKYYYTFRAVDGHDNISNPTAVYEVELIDEHGSVKPLIRIFNFEPPKYFDAIKECQQYLMIRPNLKQLYYNSEKDVLDDHMFNETNDDADPPIAKRKFKIRITSKSTGKKIDLNIDFSKKKIPEET